MTSASCRRRGAALQIHYVGSAHTDLHPGNVLYVRMADRVTFKIADLGLRERWVDARGNPERPELLLDDVRSAARLLTEVAKGQVFDGPAAGHLQDLPGPIAHVLDRALKGEYSFADGEAAMRFLNAIAETDPAAQFLSALERACDDSGW